MRRAIAAVVIVIVIVLILIGVSSCESNAGKTALENYATSVHGLISRSQSNSSNLFQVLRQANSSNGQSSQTQIARIAQSASGVLHSAQRQSVPSPARLAQANLVQALRLRYDGISAIANNIQPAVGASASQSGVDQIAAGMARFYASDVLYKLYSAPELARTLHSNNVAVGGTNGVQINPDQFLPSLSWLSSGYIANRIGAGGAAAGGPSAPGPGPHGSKLNSVQFNGATLQTSGTTIPASPPPTFTLNFENSGASVNRNVRCRVTVAGISDVKTVAQIAPGQSTTCTVTLPKSPPAGAATLHAEVEKVPGETNLANNRLSFPVTFTG